MKIISLIKAIFGSALGRANSQDDQNLISPSETYKLMNSNNNVVVLDVRSEQEYKSETGHLKDAILIPITELQKRIKELNKYKSNEIIIYCKTGHRSSMVLPFLLKYGFKVRDMEGGITKWNSEDLPVIKE